MSLISADQVFPIAAVLLSLVALGLWAETHVWGQRVGGPLLILFGAMLLSNLSVIPYSAPLYGTIAGILVPVAIPLLLLRADLKTVFRESGPMLVAFILAAGATIAGAFAGIWLIDMGPLEAQISGSITASYIGGSLNFVSTAEALGIKDSSIYIAALSADAVGAVIFLAALMALPAIGFVRRALPSKFIDDSGKNISQDAPLEEKHEQRPFDLRLAANGIAISLTVCALGYLLTRQLGLESLFILVITMLALLVANLGKGIIKHVESDFQIGTYFMYIFFAAIGAGANIQDVIGAAFPVLLFILVMVAVHLALLIGIGKSMKLDLAEIMIASNACILGPAPAAALAASKGWQSLVTPGMLVGILGYAVATFIGVTISSIVG